MNHHGVACTASHLLLGCWCRDGLGGVVKRRLREDITNGKRDGKTVDIKTARGCYDHIDSTLGSEDWAKKHAGFKVSRFKCVWGTTDDFNRPADKNKDEYHPLTGCRESRQFLAMRESVVCHRSFACWCRACLHSKGGSGLDGGKSLNGSVRFAVHQCASSSQDSRMWTELDVSKSTAAASAVTRASAQAKGKEIAGSAKVGEHVIARRAVTTPTSSLSASSSTRAKAARSSRMPLSAASSRPSLAACSATTAMSFSPSSGSFVTSRMPSAGRFTNRVTRTRLAV